MNPNPQYKGLWLLAPLLQCILLALMAQPANSLECLVLASFVGITAFSAQRLFADPLSYSLNKVWWLFHVVFMGIVPSVQAAVHSAPWHLGDISSMLMLRTNMLLFGCLFTYEIINRSLKRKTTPNPIPVKNPPIGYVKIFHFAAPAVTIICAAILLKVFGVHGLFLRGHLEAAALKYSTTFQLLTDKGLRGIMLYVSIISIILYRQKELPPALLTALLLLTFVFNFPLALPRYLSFTFYMGWLLAAALPIFKRKNFFTLVVLSLLLFAGPFISITRYAGIDMQERFSDPKAVFKKAYLVSDFDAYSSLCRTIQYVTNNGSTHGRQLEGVLLFFVPRSYWPAKPIGSGAYLFTQLNFDFKNVSCTYLAEGFINFGWLGSLLFTLLMAAGIRLYDHYFWQNIGTFRYLHLFYFITIGMLFFLLRGDLMSSFAYTTGLFTSGWMLHQAIRLISKTTK